MKKKINLLLGLALISVMAVSMDASAQSFNKNNTIWFPWESNDFNAGFKHSFLDLEAFVSSSVDIGNKWTIDISFGARGDATWTESVYLPGEAVEDAYEMVAWYLAVAEDPNSVNSAEYNRGLYEGALAFSSLIGTL